jgi:hypothetical protein
MASLGSVFVATNDWPLQKQVTIKLQIMSNVFISTLDAQQLLP